jgi:ABC-type multidrug transport system fused ATPase/permease subunit
VSSLISIYGLLYLLIYYQNDRPTKASHTHIYSHARREEQLAVYLVMSSAKATAATATAAVPPASASFFVWRPSVLYERGVQTYHVTLTYISRVWTPPPVFDGVESASFVFVLSTALFAMEGFHAVRYTLRQLRRFKTETALQHITLLGGGLREVQVEKEKSCKTTAVAAAAQGPGLAKKKDDKDTDEDAEVKRLADAAASNTPHPHPWYDGVMQRVRALLPSRPTKPSTLGDEVAGGDHPLQTLDFEESECDYLSRGPSVPFEMSNLPTQRGVSQVSYATTDGAPSMGVHDEGDHEDEDEEDQTWEATPEMLMHYWRQLQRTILTAPRRNPKKFFRSLPDEMTTYEPDTAAVHAWFDDITYHLHGGSSMWSWFTAGAVEEDSDGTTAATAAAAKVRPPGWQQRLTFTVPPNGCFAYHVKPPLDDFYPDAETDEEDEEDEEGEEAEAALPEGEGAQGESSQRGVSAGAGKEDGSTEVTEVPAPTTGETAEEETGGAVDQEPQHHERRHVLRWEALLLVWFNVAEVPMSSREIRALLLKASPPAFMSPAMVRDGGPTDFDVASTNLTILWFWSTLQRVFETLVINEDVEKCEDDIKELQSYATPLFMKCIARWPVPSQMGAAAEAAFSRGLVCFICIAQSAWITLNAVMHKLLSLRRRLYYRNTWSLMRYMYSSSKAKMMSAALITVMMTISSRVSVAGRVVRERIASYVENSADEGGSVAEVGGVKLNLRLMLGLCAFELTRMAVQYVISNTTSEFIVLTASQRREVVKMQLYEALSHTQLTFYEQHTYEEVEEIIYYVSDMEGIDVQLHQYLFNAINVFMELKDALQPLTYRSMVVAACVAMAPYALRSVATMVEQRYLLAQREGYLPSGAYAVEDEYQGEDDDANVLREGAMLRGEEIIAAIPQLRPYGADVRLVRWWNRHQQRRQHIKMTYQQRGDAAADRKGGDGASMRSSPRTGRGPTSAGRRSTTSTGGGGTAAAVGRSTSRETWGEYFRRLTGTWVTDEDIGLVRSALTALVQLPHGKLLPGSGKALLDLSEWLLPMAASAYGIAWCGQPNLDPFQLVQGMQAIEAAVDSISEAMDTAEMVGYNAYKASMLERLLQPSQWEVISREEEPYMANFTISANGVGHANDARQYYVAQTQLTTLKPPTAPTRSTAPLMPVTAARVAGFYRRHVLRHIELRNIRLRHMPMDPMERRRRRRGPSSQSGSGGGGGGVAARRATLSGAPGVSPSSATGTPGSTSLLSGGDNDDEEGEEEDEGLCNGAPLFSADVVLWSPPQQRGRFVCFTGPNGGGKTALVNLLLALYVNTSGALPSSVESSPHAGRLGSGTVTFCFARRTQARRHHRRGGLTGRAANASGANLARTGRSVCDSARPRGPADALMSPGARCRSDGLQGGGGSSHAASAANTGRSMPAFSSRTNYGMPTDRAGDVGGESRVDIRTIPADVLRRHIFSYVPEMPTIFAGATVAQNISLAGYVSVATDSLMRRVTQCAELAQCDFIQRLPLGLLTRISDSTANSWNTAGQYSTGTGNTTVTRLSADQAKRLMLARAYFHGGEVLLLDEPTKEIEDSATAQRMCEGWCKLLERGYCSGVICTTMDEALLKMADEVITLP